MLTLRVCPGKPGAPLPNTAKAICIWDPCTFSDEGVFGRMPDGWYKQQYPFITHAILMTFTGGTGTSEWLTMDERGNPQMDFTVPLQVLRNVCRQGLSPLIVIGNVPYPLSDAARVEADSYGWGNRLAPVDYAAYAAYIEGFARMIRENFPPETYRDWMFRVGTEPDNPHWWVEGEEEYCRLYDYTVTALQKVLGKENLTVFSGNLETYDKFEGVYEHCLHGVNACTGQVGTQNDAVSISHYQLGTGCVSMKEAGAILEYAARRARKYADLGIRSVHVGEGQFLSDGCRPPHRLQMAQDGTAYAASWTAAMYDLCCRYGIEYFANWAYCTDCFRVEEPMLRIPAYHVAAWIGQTAGLPRLEVTLDGESDTGNIVGGVAAFDEAGKTVRILAYCHGLDRQGRPEEAQVVLPLPGGGCGEVTAWCIDRGHSNFFTAWLEDSREIQRVEQAADFDVLGSVLDTEVAQLLEGPGLEFWLTKKREYAGRDGLEQIPCSPVLTDDGLRIPCRFDGHSVLLFEVKTTQGGAANGQP